MVICNIFQFAMAAPAIAQILRDKGGLVPATTSRFN